MNDLESEAKEECHVDPTICMQAQKRRRRNGGQGPQSLAEKAGRILWPSIMDCRKFGVCVASDDFLKSIPLL